MSLLENAWLDNQNILENGFSRNIQITSSIDNNTYDVMGFLTNHNSNIDVGTGLDIISKKVPLSINIKSLNDINYPIYKPNNITDINMNNDKISFFDSNDKLQNYIIENTQSDPSINLITLSLISENNAISKPDPTLRNFKK